MCLCDLQGRLPWDPDTMHRATREFKADLTPVTVLDCADMKVVADINAHTFFRG